MKKVYIIYDFMLGIYYRVTHSKMPKTNKRNYIGYDISEEYVKLANRRIAEMSYNEKKIKKRR